jgi:hypothetical protein
MAESSQQLGLVALPLLCVMGSEPVGGRMFISGYVAGIAVQVGFRETAEESLEFTEGWRRLLDLTVVRMLPVAISLIGTRLSAATAVFMGWFGPRGLASVVLGLVYLEQESHLPGESTIRLAVMATVLLSIFAHGFSAMPGIGLYARKIATLDVAAPEHLAVVDTKSLSTR